MKIIAGLFGNIWPYLLAAAAALAGFVGVIWKVKRDAVRADDMAEELEGRRARDKVEEDHATDTHQDRLDRLRRASERDAP